MKVQGPLKPHEINALTAIAKSRIPQAVVLYDASTGQPVAYIGLN